MLDRYRMRCPAIVAQVAPLFAQPAPAAPEAPTTAGAEITALVRAAPAAPAAPAGISKARAADVLERFAAAHGIDWTAARSQMIEGDAEAGAAQLAADTGDGIEHAGVACWLHLLAERAPPACTPWPTGYREGATGLDTYGRPLPVDCQTVTCGSCQHFEPDPINPPAGAGTCRAGVGHLSVGKSLHPMTRRLCDHHSGELVPQ
mgnify:CR=1 FL=1